MKTFGGNSGYIGYSKSVRAYNAEREGRFPKTIFKKKYGLTEKTFNFLENRGIIGTSGEWHHTSKYGNKTQYYGIQDNILFAWYTEGKEEAFRLYKQTRMYYTPVFRNKKKYGDDLISKANAYATAQGYRIGTVFPLFGKQFQVDGQSKRKTLKYCHLVVI